MVWYRLLLSVFFKRFFYLKKLYKETITENIAAIIKVNLLYHISTALAEASKTQKLSNLSITKNICLMIYVQRRIWYKKFTYMWFMNTDKNVWNIFEKELLNRKVLRVVLFFLSRPFIFFCFSKWYSNKCTETLLPMFFVNIPWCNGRYRTLQLKRKYMQSVFNGLKWLIAFL